MFVRRDSRGYYHLLRSRRDPVTRQPRHEHVLYLGRSADVPTEESALAIGLIWDHADADFFRKAVEAPPEVTLARIRRERLDGIELESLILAGKIRIRCIWKTITLRLAREDAFNWRAHLTESDSLAGLVGPPIQLFEGETLADLTAGIRDEVVRLESEADVDSGLRIEVNIEPAFDCIDPHGSRELRNGLWFFRDPLKLIPPEQEPLPEVLTTSEAVGYMRKKHRMRITQKSLREAVDEGRLSCFLGSYKSKSFGATLVGPDSKKPWERPKGVKKWGALGFYKDDLDLYAVLKNVPREKMWDVERAWLRQREEAREKQ